MGVNRDSMVFLDVETVASVRAMVDEFGEPGACSRLFIHVHTLMRILAGRPMSRGIALHLRDRLAAPKV